MNTHLNNKMIISIMIMIFVGWGVATVTAYDFHSTDQAGIASDLFVSTSDSNSSNAITSKGYCLPRSDKEMAENIDSFSEGETGIASHLTISDAINGSNREIEGDASHEILCVMIAPEETRFNNEDRYSWGEKGGIN